MFDRRLVEYFDWGLLLIVFLIAVAGLGVLYSAVSAGAPGATHVLFEKQILWMCTGAIIIFFSLMVHYKYLNKNYIIIYALCIALLIGVLIFGRNISGSKRWLSFGHFAIQPSELMKLSLIIVLSSIYSPSVSDEGMCFKELLKPGLFLALPFLLILKQPDLGTAMLLVLISASMTLFVKVQKKVFFTILLIAAVALPLIWIALKDYQKMRILTFINPDRDPLGAGYHIIQSKIAIGSGGVFGKGFGEGTQGQLNFLPAHHTDFIFSVFSEEWGFFGAMLVLILFLTLALWSLAEVLKSKNLVSAIQITGIVAIFISHVLINIGMTTGLMPVVGVPLPFFSYGGSSMLSMMFGIGLLLNIRMRRFEKQ